MRSRPSLVLAGLALLLFATPGAGSAAGPPTATAAHTAIAAAAASPTPTAGRSFGPGGGLHVVVLGDPAGGYRAELYDGPRHVARRGMTGDHDLTVLPGAGRNQPSGPDLLGAATGQLDWNGPVQNGVGSVPGTVTPTTTAGGASAVRWTQASAGADTWIYVGASGLTAGGRYRATVTLSGTGRVFLDVYDGRQDVRSGAVTLSDTAQTLTQEFTEPAGSGDTAQIQIRTSTAGPVDLVASATSLRAVQPVPVTAANLLSNRYSTVSYDRAAGMLTLSGAVDSVGAARVARSETYRFVTDDIVDARVTTATAGGPITYWYTPYTEFDASLTPLSAAGPAASYESPNPSNALRDSPIPVVGAADRTVTYGMAAASTWDEPMPGYSPPHVLIQGRRLAAPQIGTDADPVVLADGGTRSYRTVFYRGAPGPYGLELGGELATARALGLGDGYPAAAAGRGDTSVAALRRVAATNFDSIARVTAYWLRMTTAAGGKALAPNQYYAHFGATTYMRDSFWTTLGLTGTPWAADTERTILGQFTAAIPASGPEAGHVPVTPGGPFFDDESGLYYLIRAYHDATGDAATAQRVLDYIRTHQVSGGAFVTAGPVTNGGFAITPDSWLDGYLFPAGAVNAYNQGLYVVALKAAKALGAKVTDAEIARATTVYRNLYDPGLGYVRWLSTKDYRSPDVLAGDALSWYLFDKPLLSDDMARRTARAQVRTAYGTKALDSGGPIGIPANEFRTLANDPATGQVVALGEPEGWYQNGGSWLLWEYLADYSAARHGDRAAAERMSDAIRSEVEVTPMSKEFKVTQNNPAIPSVDPAWPYPLGSTGLNRQGFGWNAAVAALVVGGDR